MELSISAACATSRKEHERSPCKVFIEWCRGEMHQRDAGRREWGQTYRAGKARSDSKGAHKETTQHCYFHSAHVNELVKFDFFEPEGIKPHHQQL